MGGRHEGLSKGLRQAGSESRGLNPGRRGCHLRKARELGSNEDLSVWEEAILLRFVGMRAGGLPRVLARIQNCQPRR